jgi:protoporphyrinogen oxidase
MKVAVIGGGISGLSIANLLNDEHEVVVFERVRKLGVIINCYWVNDCLFHKVGGHVFNSKNQKVLDWFWAHFDRDNEFVHAKRKAKIFFDNAIIGYPIENYIYLLDKATIKKIFDELVELQRSPRLLPMEYDNFETFLKNNFGETLYNIYFEPYNKKIWQTDLSTVAMEWLDGKLPMPFFKEIVISNILREEEGGMVHSSFYYPKENGSQFIVDRFKKGLNIQTGVNITDIKNDGDGLLVGTDHFDKLVYCGDIRRLPDNLKQLLTDGGVNVSYIEQLRSNGTSNLFCETDENDISWLYIPQNFTKAHRIIYTGNFSDTNNRGSNRKTCVVEFSGEVDYEVMVEEIKSLPGNLTPLAYNYEPNSYVIQDKNTRKVIAAAKVILEKHGIYLLGRFAEWEYYNMDKAIEAAFEIAKEFE